MRDTPHLIDSSTMIYFGEWSDFGLEFIAVKHLEDDDSEITLIHPLKNIKNLTNVMIEMYHDITKQAITYYHETDHYVYVSPQLFESFVQTFKRLYDRRTTKLYKHLKRFQIGLDGLNKSKEFTEAKQEELSKQSPLLVQKQIEIEKILETLEVHKNKIDKHITLKL